MPKTAHTPMGVIFREDEKAFIVVDHNGNFYAKTYSSLDAKEIAAAPETAAELERVKAVNKDLMEALRAMCEFWRFDTGSVFDPQKLAAYEQARAALAKAEGKS